jgi:hypothetical protein
MEKEKTFWGIHAGKTGDAEALFENLQLRSAIIPAIVVKISLGREPQADSVLRGR